MILLQTSHFYLGHEIRKSGVETEEIKVEKILNLTVPIDKRGVKSLATVLFVLQCLSY